MSYVTVKALKLDGTMTDYGTASNAWGGAVHIWKTLGDKYVPGGFSLFNPDPTWKALDRMEPWERWVMGSTFDDCIVRQEHLPSLIDALERFCETHPSPTLRTEIELLRKALSDPEVDGVAFWQTSVTSDPWIIDDRDGDDTHEFNLMSDDKTGTGGEPWYLTPEELELEAASG